MAGEVEQARERPGWGSSAGWWLVGWLLVSAALVAAALAAALFAATMAGRPAPGGGNVADSVEAMARITAAMLPVAIALSGALALLAGLPLQVSALHLRRRGEGSSVFATVAVLTCLSAILSFGLLYWRYTIYAALFQPSTALLTGMLAGFYAAHVAVLHVARALAERRAPPGHHPA